jgi:hypothetical protein
MYGGGAHLGGGGMEVGEQLRAQLRLEPIDHPGAGERRVQLGTQVRGAHGWCHHRGTAVRHHRCHLPREGNVRCR